MICRLFTSVLFVASAISEAHASSLILNYEGTTDVDSSWAGNPITVGTAFDIHAVFETPGAIPDVGVGEYLVDSITGQVGGTSFSAIFTPGDFSVILADPSSTLSGVYLAALFGGLNVGFAPIYLTATPTLDATAATPTVFSNFLGNFTEAGGAGNSILFSNATGDLVLTYDAGGVNASITEAIPVPSTLVMSSILFGMFGSVWSYKRLKHAPLAA